ncbi:hypothetical protein C8R47DRAFT_1159807 [Mycena vitilis]|nr:hypothetical protein C8R47DRAFT_1159807 [Mycena vitilis]
MFNKLKQRIRPGSKADGVDGGDSNERDGSDSDWAEVLAQDATRPRSGTSSDGDDWQSVAKPESPRPRSGESFADYPLDAVQDSEPVYLHLLRDRNAARLALDTADSRLKDQYQQLSARNREMTLETRQKEERLWDEKEEERALIAAARRINVRVDTLAAQIESILGKERFERWNASRADVVKIKPTVPAALHGVPNNVLKEYIQVSKPQTWQ